MAFELTHACVDLRMQQILQEAQKNPQALMEHRMYFFFFAFDLLQALTVAAALPVKNEGFRKKIMKLQSAGILKMGP